MKLNVWDWPYRPRYYLTHPWKWFRELWINIKAAWMRMTRGWCYSDVWNLDSWMLAILPEMFRYLANHYSAYPGRGEFDTPEKWEDHLNSMADVFESLQEDVWFGTNRNEYLDDLERAHENEKCKNLTMANEVDLDTVRKLFLEREKELREQRDKLIMDTFITMAKNFDNYWD